MDLFCENADVLHQFTGKNSLVDAEIEKIEIGKVDEGVVIDVHLCMRPSSDWSKIRIRFIHCLYYSFYHSNDVYFHLIDRLKFFVTDESYFYASFDPYDEEKCISSEDNDVICAKRIQGYQST